MLFALPHPLALVGLVLGFVVGVVVAGMVSSRCAARFAVGSGAERERRTPRIERHIDPFGTIAAALGGVGWGVPLEPGRWRRGPARRKLILALLTVPVTHLVLAAAAIVSYYAVNGPEIGSPQGILWLLRGEVSGLTFTQLTLVGFAVANATMAMLHVVPLPPMTAGRILFLVAPQSAGWQKAEYHLEHNNWGIGILLALSLPIFGGGSLVASLTAALAAPFLDTIGTVVA